MALVSMNAFRLGETLQALAPRERILFGYPDAGGTFRADLLWGNLGAEVHLGEAVWPSLAEAAWPSIG